MNDELQLGKYEFFPYKDEQENKEGILEELKKLLTTDKEVEQREDILEKFIKSRKKVRRK